MAQSLETTVFKKINLSGVPLGVNGNYRTIRICKNVFKYKSKNYNRTKEKLNGLLANEI